MVQHIEVNGVDHKFCGICERWLPVYAFHRCGAASDGLQINCKDCRREMARKDAAGNTRRSQSSYHRHHAEQLAIRAARRAVMDEADIVHDASFQKRFWAKVRKTDGCWEWQVAVSKQGYGMIGFNGGVVTAHRAAWILTNGPIPDGLFVCHHCDDRKCCNPDHMFLGTLQDNTRDMVSKGRQGAARGEDHPSSLLTWDAVRDLRARYKAGGVLLRELAAEYGVATPTIASAIRNRSWHDPEYVPLPSRKG